MDIYCFKYTVTGLRTVGIIDDFSSFNFNRSYGGIGEWSLVLNEDKYIEGDIIRADGRLCGLVTHVAAARGSGGGITVSGIELKGLARQRIVYPPFGSDELKYSNVSVDTVLQGLITTQMISPFVSARVIPLVAYDYGTAGTPNIYYSGRYGNLDEEIQAVCDANGVGWDASFTKTAITFRALYGLDRTEGQRANQKCIISYGRDVIAASRFDYDKYRVNTGIVAGQGEGAARTIITVNNNSGIQRYEGFFDARDINTTAELRDRGKEKLSENSDMATYEATAEQHFISLYHELYELGDVVTVVDDLLPDGSMNMRITNIEEVYESGNILLNLTFGYNKQDFQNAFKRMRKGTSAVTAI